MKRKIKGVLGVGLAVILITSLFGFALPVSAAAPLPKINEWTQFNYPKEGATGGWFWDSAIQELGPMDKALNGDIYIYANVPRDANGEHKILRSTDGGRSWTDSTSPLKYDNVSAIGGQEVVDMVCSSLLEDVLYVTDGDYVYKSSNNATTWTVVAQADLEKIIMGACGTPVTGEPITCIDVGYDASNRPYVFIGVKTIFATSKPDILYIDELAIGATWLALNLPCYDTASTYTPYAVGVTPDFATAPIKLMAVVTTHLDNDSSGPETHVISSNLGVCGWGEVAELVWNCVPTNHFEINHSSRIGYPDDYTDARTLFVGVTAWTGSSTNTAGGDVYSVITFPAGTATDLNVEGSKSGCIGTFDGTNICGLDVCGDTADAAVIAGAMDAYMTQDPTNVYTSIDGGWTWVTSLKDPTGAGETWVQWVGAECGATALAATQGCDCAVSINCADVLYWNQASLIATCFDCMLWADFSPGYYQTGESDTMFMLTYCAAPCGDSEHAYNVFRYVGDPTLAGTSSPEHPWDRVFSSLLYNAAGVMDSPEIHFLTVSPDFLTTNAVFIGNRGFEIWRSLDAGCSWFKFQFPCFPRPAASFAMAVDKETGVVGGNGAVYKTTRHGTRPWTPATIATGTLGWVLSFDYDGNTFLLGDSTAQVFISTDGALTWNLVGNCAAVLTAAGGKTETSVAFDPGYAVSGDPGENTIYASAGNVIARCVIDPTLPMAYQTWYAIYTDTDADFWGMRTVGDTALYVGDRAASDYPSAVDDGGMVRSLSPTAALIGTNPCEFERVNFGLSGAEILTGLELTSGVNGCPDSNVLWAEDLCGTAVNQARLWFFEDTLARQVDLVSPANGAKGLSAVIGTTTATIEWEALCGATCYEKEVWYFCPGCDEKTFVEGFPHCFDCAVVPPCVGCSGETCCEVVGTPTAPLLPGVTYYWRVRVGGVPGACEVGCPMLSKWSETYMFTTAMETPVRCSPICGAENITLTPNFSWTEISGATGYQIDVSTNEDFDPILASGSPTINAWDGIPQLEYGTTYYWRVRSVRDGVVSSWTYCLFSTEEAPPEEAPYVWTCPQCGLTFTSEAALQAHIDAEHGPPATPLYVWVIIGIGAALVIAVIVLIALTRRPA